MQRQLVALQQRHDFDIVVAEYVYISKLLTFFPDSVRKIIDTHDVFADRHRRMATAAGVNTFYSISAAAERRGLCRADIVIAIQDQEAMYLEAQLGNAAEVIRVSHFVEVSPLPYRIPASSAAFLGSNSLGNVDTLRNLVANILPLVLAEIPTFKLYVAGTVCSVTPDYDHVVKLGTVDDPEEIYGRAPLLLTPTIVGTGVAIKTLDALGMGIPVVTTVTGARGHDGGEGGLYVTDDADAGGFARNAIELLRNPGLHRLASDAALVTAKVWNLRQQTALRAALGGP